MGLVPSWSLPAVQEKRLSLGTKNSLLQVPALIIWTPDQPSRYLLCEVSPLCALLWTPLCCAHPAQPWIASLSPHGCSLPSSEHRAESQLLIRRIKNDQMCCWVARNALATASAGLSWEVLGLNGDWRPWNARRFTFKCRIAFMADHASFNITH